MGILTLYLVRLNIQAIMTIGWLWPPPYLLPEAEVNLPFWMLNVLRYPTPGFGIIYAGFRYWMCKPTSSECLIAHLAEGVNLTHRNIRKVIMSIRQLF